MHTPLAANSWTFTLGERTFGGVVRRRRRCERLE